jgi:splicing factor 3A subunit 1
MDEHVRIELLDPKWREQKAKAAEKNATSNLLSGRVISDNLRRISTFRTDIFEGDETTIEEKAGCLRSSKTVSLRILILLKSPIQY